MAKERRGEGEGALCSKMVVGEGQIRGKVATQIQCEEEYKKLFVFSQLEMIIHGEGVVGELLFFYKPLSHIKGFMNIPPIAP